MPATGQPSGSSQTFDAVAEFMKSELDGSAVQLTEAIHEALEELEDDLYTATLSSCRANVGVIATMLSDRVKPAVAVPPPEALSYARELVQRGVGFEVLQRAYRIGQATLSRLWLERLHQEATDADDLATNFAFVNKWMFGYVDAIEYRLTEYSMRERERHLLGTTAMRADLVREILDGQNVDPVSTSAKLRYELDRKHVSFAIWAKDGNSETQSNATFDAMERVAGEVSALLGATDHLSIPVGGRLACWAGLRGKAALAQFPSALASARPHGLLVTIGRQGAGIDGFRRSHEEARLARRVVGLEDLPAGSCRQFSALALDALLTRDVDEAKRFVEWQLGALGEDSDSARRLRATLEVFLGENGSYLHAAQRLGVHENTVGYRVRRAEELLERPVKDSALDLRAALRLSRLGI